jgi:hypothetical protein
MTATDGWEGILDADEDIIWQGRPDSKIAWGASNIFTLIFGLFFAGFALFWMVMASMAGGFFWMFGLIHFTVGIGIAFGTLFYSAYKRRQSWYTLTNKRAFIASNLPLLGKKLKSYPITADPRLEIVEGTPASILFATEMHRTKNGTTTVKLGFERIENGREVYAKFREVQKAAR